MSKDNIIHDCNPPFDVRSVYLDVFKAFDWVWHDGLIYELKRCGVPGMLLSILQSFLKDRKQRTVLDGQCSNWGDILGGVPKGSIPGTTAFSADLKCNGKLFADATSLLTVAQEPYAAAGDLNSDLKLISKWAQDCTVCPGSHFQETINNSFKNHHTDLAEGSLDARLCTRYNCVKNF